MKFILGLIIFLTILFIYLHLHVHLKISNELEVFDLEELGKEKLEEICDLKQPFIFPFSNEAIDDGIKSAFTSVHATTQVNIRNKNDKDHNTINHIPINYSDSLKLFQKDVSGNYYSEKNDELLQDTHLLKCLKNNDHFLRPSYMMNNHYDVMYGSKDSYTTFQYKLNYRNYYYVSSGSIEVKLTPYTSIRYLYPQYDYESLEFYSSIDPWNTQPEFKKDLSKVKVMEIQVPKGSVIYIPPYWFHSIKFGENTKIISFEYRTYMNNVAIIPELSMHLFQMNNLKRNNVKRANIKMDNTDFSPERKKKKSKRTKTNNK